MTKYGHVAMETLCTQAHSGANVYIIPCRLTSEELIVQIVVICLPHCLEAEGGKRSFNNSTVHVHPHRARLTVFTTTAKVNSFMLMIFTTSMQ